MVHLIDMLRLSGVHSPPSSILLVAASGHVRLESSLASLFRTSRFSTGVRRSRTKNTQISLLPPPRRLRPIGGAAIAESVKCRWIKELRFDPVPGVYTPGSVLGAALRSKALLLGEPLEE
jgi:hypothetical protein